MKEKAIMPDNIFNTEIYRNWFGNPMHTHSICK